MTLQEEMQYGSFKILNINLKATSNLSTYIIIKPSKDKIVFKA